ncbi:MAG: hypothetical protein Q9227_007341 [Pyrenula ochraceoflavens]
MDLVYTEVKAPLRLSPYWRSLSRTVGWIKATAQDQKPTFGDVVSEPRPHLNFATQASIISGLSLEASEISQQLTATCGSGTCKWEGYQSLAICSACHDVSIPFFSGRTSQIADLAAWFGDPKGVNGANITWFVLPGNGLNMNNPDDYTFGDGSTERITMTGQANWDPKQSISFKNSSTFLFSMSVMWANLDKDYKYPDWPRTNVSATECSLYLCVKNFDTHITNGTLTENSTEIASVREMNSYQPLGALVDSTPAIEPLYDWNQTLERTDLQIRLPRNSSTLNQFDHVNVSQPAVEGLVWYLNHAFDDGSLWGKIPVPDLRTIDMLQLIPNITGLVRLVPGTHSFQFLPEIMQVFWTAKAKPNGIQTMFANLATSLTNNIRMTADNSTHVAGQEGTAKTFICIRWIWIVLPGVTIILSATFLALAMYENKKAKMPLWKDSELPSLFHGLSDDMKKELGHRSALNSEMEKDATGMNARLVRVGGDLVLGKFPRR